MSRIPLPDPSIQIEKKTARQFLLAAQGLLPPREKEGKNGVLQVIRDLNSIQYDPVNIVGRNPDLVLQSRVKDYKPRMLDELLYKVRMLIDGWDKMASIFPVEDWPYFSHHRAKMREQHGTPDGVVMRVAPDVLQRIRSEGPQSSLEFKDYPKEDWSWGPTRASRAALEGLYAMGVLGIDHRENHRRYFDLIARLLPGDVLQAPDPNQTLESYQSWHIKRRIGSVKLAHAHAGEHWGGILKVKSRKRRKILQDLVEEGEVHALAIAGIPRHVFFILDQDLPLLEAIPEHVKECSGAAFIAPLDNLIWNRKLVRLVFGFDYAWEVYKPKVKREYGYYVLPVLAGDRLVARVEPVLEKKSGRLKVRGWWWEEGIPHLGQMENAIKICIREFMAYIGAEGVGVDRRLEGGMLEQWIEELC